MAKKQVKPRLKFKVMLNKQLWVVNLYTAANFEKMWPDAIALARYDHIKNKYFELNFAGPKVSKDTIAHEIWHAYMSYKDYSRRTPAKLEEDVCELIGKKYRTLYKLTESIYNRLSK